MLTKPHTCRDDRSDLHKHPAESRGPRSDAGKAGLQGPAGTPTPLCPTGCRGGLGMWTPEDMETWTGVSVPSLSTSLGCTGKQPGPTAAGDKVCHSCDQQGGWLEARCPPAW